MLLHFSDGKHDTVKVEHRGKDGGLLASEATTFKRGEQFREVAGKFGVCDKALMRAIDAWRRAGDKGAVVAVEVPPPDGSGSVKPAEPFAVILRGRHQKAAEGTRHPSIQAALAAPCDAPEPVVHWKDSNVLCMVDADLHAVPYEKRLQSALSAEVTPRPLAHWRTHGRGLRLVYEAQAGFTARELAAVACLSVAVNEPLATLELKTVTRHPGHPLPNGRECSPVIWQTQTADTAALAAWLGTTEADSEQVTTYLSERGLEVGRRYAHEHCPVDGTDPAGREPVCVRDGGIFCHACGGRGLCRGSRTPGWFPFAALCGSVLPTPLRTAIEHKVHWEHAKFLVAEYTGLGGEVARAAYSASLVCRGHDRRTVTAALTAGRNFVRFAGRWATLAGESYTKNIQPILERLPACQYTDADGIHTDPETVARFEQPIDLGDFGYLPLHPVWGIRIHGHRLASATHGSLPIVLQTGVLTHAGRECLRPCYLPAAKRGAEDAAWGVLGQPFPGLNRAAVKLLVAARGCMEGEVGMPPLVFISGPSGSAKSSVVQIAAAICGDASHSVTWTGQPEKLRQGIADAKEHGSYCVFNEFLKDSSKGGRGAVAAMDFLLNITKESTAHKLYLGHIPLGTPPVCVWTDTYVPAELMQDAQLARRLVHVRLNARLDAWKDTIKAHGINQPADVRVADQRFADACNVILSCVIDDYFSHPQTFQEIAEQLGFFTLEQTAEAEEGHDALRALFAAACSAPPPAGADAKRWSGRGWRLISREHQTDLADAWRQVCDEGFTTSRRCTEVDWSRLLGLPGPVTFETRSHGNKVAVRWVRYRTRTDYEATSELATPQCGLSWDITLPEYLQ